MLNRIYVVFKTHLDVGFTQLAKDVEKKYLNEYFPAAIVTANWFRDNFPKSSYIWTVGSWLIWRGLEKLKGRRLTELEAAIVRGDITWHALPFTTHSELCDRSLFEYGLSLSRRLDERFGVKTIAAKMTDVPGHTRGIIAPLCEAGVRLLHIGVNPASKLPDVPPLFKWRDSGGRELFVIYQEDYGQTLTLPQVDFGLHVDVTGDNLGPHSPQKAMQVIKKLQRNFPGAEVAPARMDDFVYELTRSDIEVPVITAEIGDTWIHGVGSDPAKLAAFRELSRLRRKWLQDGVKSSVLDKFSLNLLEVAEHTWGGDEKIFFPKERDHTKQGLARLRKTARAATFEKTWAEQRKYLDSAIAALPEKMRREAKDSIAAITPRKTVKNKFAAADIMQAYDTDFFRVKFNPADGSISSLIDKSTNKVLADGDRNLFSFSYQTFSSLDYRRFMHQYLRIRRRWAISDFSKPGLPATRDLSRTYTPEKVELNSFKRADAVVFMTRLFMPPIAIKNYGCPAKVCIEYAFSRKKPEITVTCRWAGKAAYRGAEALWLGAVPHISPDAKWSMEKMSHRVSPIDVISHGARGLHAINGEIAVTDGKNSLVIESSDAVLVAPGNAGLLNFDNQLPDMTAGLRFNLYNNIWGTNFPMWYDEDALFRFTIKCR